jgi:hypothetical protein
MLPASAGGNRAVNYNLARREVAEAIGTTMLLAAVAGSDIMA